MTDIVPPQARKASSGPVPPGFVPPYFEYVESEEINIAECVRRVWAQRRFVAAVAALVTVAALVVAFTTPPVYRAEMLLAPVHPSKSDGLGSLIGQFGELATLVEAYTGGPKDRTAESIATLKSRALALSFISAHNLKPALFAREWNVITQEWRDPRDVPTDLAAYEVFDKGIRQVTVDRRTGLVTLAMEWSDPRLAATWANALTKEVNARRRAEAIEEARTSIAYLEQQLAKNSAVEIQQAIYRLIEAQTKTITMASTREEYAFRIIDPAVAPEKRIRPNRLAILASGFCLGLALAIGLALFRHGRREP